jgi:hypothetical protein
MDSYPIKKNSYKISINFEAKRGLGFSGFQIRLEVLVLWNILAAWYWPGYVLAICVY